MEDIYQTYLIAHEIKKLKAAIGELGDMSPAPMNTMLERQSRDEALIKRTQRKGKAVKDVPPTTPGNFNKLGYRDIYCKVQGWLGSVCCVPAYANLT